MSRKKGYFRYLLSVLLVVLSLVLGSVESAEAAGSKTGRISVVSTSKKKKSKKNNQKNNNQEKNTAGDTKTETAADGEAEVDETEAKETDLSEDGEYTSKEEVSLYLHTFGHLPDNYITKKEARALGWVSSEGNLWKVAPGKSIGGDYFGNYEEILPVVKGRSYYECDIDTDGHYRGAKRIIFSNDGWIYYTEDHYETFEELYPGEE